MTTAAMTPPLLPFPSVPAAVLVVADAGAGVVSPLAAVAGSGNRVTWAEALAVSPDAEPFGLVLAEGGGDSPAAGCVWVGSVDPVRAAVAPLGAPAGSADVDEGAVESC